MQRNTIALPMFIRPGNRARVMLFVYTHAEETTGDLFYNSNPQAGALKDASADFNMALDWRTNSPEW